MAGTQAEAAGGSDDGQLLALVISFFIPGGGQLYQGRTKEGAAFLAAFVLSIVVGGVLTVITLGLGLILVPILVGAVWAVGLYDTHTEWLDL